jgi:Tfp pilus assembly protein PilX
MFMPAARRSNAPGRRARRGAALMICMFFIFLTTLLVVNVLDTVTIDLSATRNSMDYDRALYLASAGVHAVAAELEANVTWRGTLVEGAYPANDTYSATAIDGAQAGTVVVTSRGVSGSITRTISASLQL